MHKTTHSTKKQTKQKNSVSCSLSLQNIGSYRHIFTPLHAIQTRSSDEKAVRPSVRLSICLSVKRVNRDKTEETSVQIFTPYETSFSLVL